MATHERYMGDVMKRLLIFFIIGKLALDIWTALLPQEQALRIIMMTAEFAEQHSCSKIEFQVEEGEEVVFSAQCLEVRL